MSPCPRKLLAFAWICGICLLAVGCQQWSSEVRISQQYHDYLTINSTDKHAEPQPLTDASIQSPLTEQSSFTLSELISTAMLNHPELRKAQATIEEAQGQFVQAGLYPNPQLGWQASELNSPGASAGRQGLVIGQNIVTADKLGIAQAAALEAISVSDWQAISQWYRIVSQVQTAYFEMLAAQREVQVNEELAKIAEESFRTSERLEKAGVGNRPNVLRAQVEWHQAQNRLQVSKQQAQAHWRLLVTAIGLKELPMKALVGQLEQQTQDYQYDQIRLELLAHHSELQAAQAAIREAEWRLRRAEAEVVPDLQFQLMPEYSYPDRSMSGQINLTVAVPVFDRKQGNRQSAQAAVLKAHAQKKAIELQLLEQLALAMQRYESSMIQVKNYKNKIIPAAEESLRLIMLGYESGNAQFDFNAVALAQTTLAQARLAYVQALKDLQLAVIELEALRQFDHGRYFRDAKCR